MVDQVEKAENGQWTQLLALVGELIDQPSAPAQTEHIAATAAKLLNGQARVWLADLAYKYPGTPGAESFPSEPPSGVMNKAFTRRGISRARAQTKPGSDSAGAAMAAPMISNNLLFGVIEVQRLQGAAFTRDEEAGLKRIATLSALAFQITRQAAIKKWRYEQLALVRDVSAQIANVLDLDELAAQVTRLIRDTFQYYYVAIFTTEPGESLLRYRACAHFARNGEAPPEDLPIPTIHLGQGIIGKVAQDGQELLASDVDREPAYRPFDSLPETKSEVAFPL
ncbi:MAG TPA: GAF domain-containing protein, partial [Anaerolineaceae bacterium]|nr:GAF domain-containing protein [Anaerolineaceae bacterium]